MAIIAAYPEPDTNRILGILLSLAAHRPSQLAEVMAAWAINTGLSLDDAAGDPLIAANPAQDGLLANIEKLTNLTDPGLVAISSSVLSVLSTAALRLLIVAPADAAPVDAVASTNTLTSDNTNVSDAIAATNTLANDTTNVSANDTITIDGKVYTWVTPVGSTEGNVLIGATADDSMTNLVRAIMHTGTPDTDYKCAAVHPTVSSSAVSGNAMTLTAKTKGAAGNLLTLTMTAQALASGGATFSGGLDAETVTVNGKVYTFKDTLTPTEGEILIGANADASLTNLVSAINHEGTPDTDYKCAAVHPTVSAGAVSVGHATILSAKTKGVAGDLLTLAETSPHLTKTGATFAGGIDGTVGAANDIITFGGQPYIATTAATVATSGAWKKLTIGSL